MKKTLIMILIISAALFGAFFLSAQTDHQSTDLSNQLLLKLKLVTNSDVINLSSRYYYISRVFREVAHVLLYAGLAFIIYSALLIFSKRILVSGLVCLGILVPFALIDEIVHQPLIEGRGYERLDLVLDFIGLGLVLTVCVLLSYLLQRIQIKNK